MTVALSSALLFRRASRVAVGVDGVRVAGTSRTRFYGYKDLDGVRVNGGDVEAHSQRQAHRPPASSSTAPTPSAARPMTPGFARTSTT